MSFANDSIIFRKFSTSDARKRLQTWVRLQIDKN